MVKRACWMGLMVSLSTGVTWAQAAAPLPPPPAPPPGVAPTAVPAPVAPAAAPAPAPAAPPSAAPGPAPAAPAPPAPGSSGPNPLPPSAVPAAPAPAAPVPVAPAVAVPAPARAPASAASAPAAEPAKAKRTGKGGIGAGFQYVAVIPEKVSNTRSARQFGLALDVNGATPIAGPVDFGTRFAWGLTDWERAARWANAGVAVGKWTNRAYVNTYNWTKKHGSDGKANPQTHGAFSRLRARVRGTRAPG